MLPFLLLIGLYFYLDPYMLRGLREEELTRYGNVELNGDYLSTENFLKHTPAYNYNTFVVGSSRAEPFLLEYWTPYLQGKVEPFVYTHRGGEGFEGVSEKLIFIAQNGDSLKNVLIILSKNTFTPEPGVSEWFKLHDYRLSNTKKITFWWKSFKMYFSKGLFVRHLDYKLFGVKRGYMKSYLKQYSGLKPSNTNDGNKELEAIISKDSTTFYEKTKKADFYSRKAELPALEAGINPQMQAKLSEIKRLFDAHQTKYKIVIVPVYDLQPLNRQDLAALTTVFGKENVYDFSGLNQFSATKYQFSDINHIRPRTAQAILAYIYSTKQE